MNNQHRTFSSITSMDNLVAFIEETYLSYLLDFDGVGDFAKHHGVSVETAELIIKFGILARNPDKI